MKAYVDTNIYDYVALRHPVYGEACREILRDVNEGELETYGSMLVAIEILGSLAEIDTNMAVGGVKAFFSLPVKIIPIDERIIESAATIALEADVSYDAVHASTMARADVSTVITEDVEHWTRIRGRWARVKAKTHVALEEIKIVRPKEYARWKVTLV